MKVEPLKIPIMACTPSSRYFFATFFAHRISNDREKVKIWAPNFLHDVVADALRVLPKSFLCHFVKKLKFQISSRSNMTMMMMTTTVF